MYGHNVVEPVSSLQHLLYIPLQLVSILLLQPYAVREHVLFPTEGKKPLVYYSTAWWDLPQPVNM